MDSKASYNLQLLEFDCSLHCLLHSFFPNDDKREFAASRLVVKTWARGHYDI